MPRPVHFFVSAALLLSSATAATLKPREEKKDETDRYGHFRVKPALAFTGAAAVTVGATALQVATPSWVQGTLGEAASSGAGAMLLKLVTKINEWKVTSPLALTMSHGLLLKAVAEVLSQVIPQRSGGAAWLDPLRVVRSTVASLLSSSLSFFYWSRLEWVRAITAPGWLRFVFGKTLGTSIAKMVTTQVIYRPINVFLFLGMQSFFRGDSARQLVQVIRKKFKQGIIGGIAFFSVSNMIMFSVPVPYLHPIIGAIAGLIFNVWLAMVAYQKVPETPTAAAATDAAPALSLTFPEMPSAVTEFPATALTLTAVGLLEGVAAASLYQRAAAASNGKGYLRTEDPVGATPTTSRALS